MFNISINIRVFSYNRNYFVKSLDNYVTVFYFVIIKKKTELIKLCLTRTTSILTFVLSVIVTNFYVCNKLVTK